MKLRKVVGFLGIALPFVVFLGDLIIFGEGLQDSISGYYYTGMRDVFVGILCAIGVFLLSYKGYETIDAVAGEFACVFALGVALFPTAPAHGASQLQQIIGHIHLGLASLYFATLAFFSLFLFTKTDPNGVPTRRKLQRNKVYRTCGTVMVLCLILIVIVHIIHSGDVNDTFSKSGLVFWLESAAVVAFGVSWITKGEAILKDVEQ
jgi:hypothetical protein